MPRDTIACRRWRLKGGHPTNKKRRTAKIYHTQILPRTPPAYEPIMGPTHEATPTKAKIQGICDFNDAHGIPYSHNDVFKWARVSKTTGWAILRQDRLLEPRTFHSVRERRN